MPHLILVIRRTGATADSSKAALVHLARILVIERGIRVNAVAPPLLDTPASRATFADEAMASTQSRRRRSPAGSHSCSNPHLHQVIHRLR